MVGIQVLRDPPPGAITPPGNVLGLGAGGLLARGDVFFRAAVGISLFCGIGCVRAVYWPPGRQILRHRLRHLGPALFHGA